MRCSCWGSRHEFRPHRSNPNPLRGDRHEEGKAAFWLSDDGKTFGALAGKLPRGEKADITITAKESVLLALWAGRRTRDEAFMAGDVKVEGAYAHWLDQVVPTFEAAPWSEAWATASKL